MKKLITAVLALTLALSLAACDSSTPAETTAATEPAAASALEVLETVWADYAEEEKFAVMGGSMAAPVDGAPGSYDLADENISYSLLIPAEQLSSVTEAASMIHMMNANTFTGAAYRLADGVAAADFAEAMRTAIQGNMWMCGFPETLLISVVDSVYVVVAFGVNDAMTPFQTHLSAVYPAAQTLISEPIA